jgi:hypothetical protein
LGQEAKVKNGIKYVVAAGASVALAVGLSATAFGEEHHHQTEAKSHVEQTSEISTEQSAEANSGDNLVGNVFGQANLTLFSWANHNDAAGVALLSTGDATSGNTAGTTVSQGNTDSVTATDNGWGHPKAKSSVDQSADIETDQTATSNTGDNVVGNVFLQLNANVASGHNSNDAAGIAAASTGDATATNSSTTSVTQSNNSTVSSTSN